MSCKTAIAVAAALLLAAPCLCAEQDAPIVLENGLRVHLKPLPAATQVALVVLFDIGEGQDPEGQSGMAHLVEHLYVTAAAGEGKARSMEDIVARYGQGWNAQTGDDYTVVATVFAPEKFDEELIDAAARMGALRISEADLARETPRMDVELANMYGGIPALAARNLARELCCPGAGGARKGGRIEQIRTIAPAQASERWARFYKPCNALLVLAGKFDPEATMKALTEKFSAIKAGEKTPPARGPGKPRFGLSEAKAPMGGDARRPVCLAWQAPRPGQDLYAPFLALVARVLSRTMNAREGTGISVGFALLDDPGVVTVTGLVSSGESAAEAVERMQLAVTEALAGEMKQSDGAMAKNFFARFLLSNPFLDASGARDPYGIAFAIGRRAQMGIVPEQISKALASLKPEEFEAARALLDPARRGAAVVKGGS